MIKNKCIELSISSLYIISSLYSVNLSSNFVIEHFRSTDFHTVLILYLKLVTFL